MNENIKNTCDLILENRDTLAGKMFWEMDPNTYAIMAGLLTAANGIKADPARYQACKKMSINKNAVHSMAQILALSNKSAEEKFAFVDGVLKGLDKNHTPIDKDQGLAVIGALSLLDIPAEQLVNDITEASNYLKGKKGFRWFEEGKRMRTTYAALAVFLTYARGNKSLAGAISGNIAMSIAEEIIMVIVVIVMVSTITSSMSH